MFIIDKPTENFTMIDNNVYKDESLSIQARFIYGLLQSYGANWKFNAKHLSKVCNMNISTFYKYMKELYSKDLVKRIQARNNDGKFSNETIYILTRQNANVDVSLILENLESAQIKKCRENVEKIIESINIDLTLQDESETLENTHECAESSMCEKNIQRENNTYNNIKDSNKKKESIAPKAADKPTKNLYATIDLKALLKSCNEYLHKQKQSLLDSKKQEEAEFNTFLDKLEWQEQEAYNDFISYRSEKKKLKPTTIRAIQSKFLKLKEAGENLSECVKISIERGWSGLFAKKDTQGQFKAFKCNAKKAKKDKEEAISFLNVSDAEMKAYAESMGIYL